MFDLGSYKSAHGLLGCPGIGFLVGSVEEGVVVGLRLAEVDESRDRLGQGRPSQHGLLSQLGHLLLLLVQRPPAYGHCTRGVGRGRKGAWISAWMVRQHVVHMGHRLGSVGVCVVHVVHGVLHVVHVLVLHRVSRPKGRVHIAGYRVTCYQPEQKKYSKSRLVK